MHSIIDSGFYKLDKLISAIKKISKRYYLLITGAKSSLPPQATTVANTASDYVTATNATKSFNANV